MKVSEKERRWEQRKIKEWLKRNKPKVYENVVHSDGTTGLKMYIK